MIKQKARSAGARSRDSIGAATFRRIQQYSTALSKLDAWKGNRTKEKRQLFDPTLFSVFLKIMVE